MELKTEAHFLAPGFDGESSGISSLEAWTSVRHFCEADLPQVPLPAPPPPRTADLFKTRKPPALGELEPVLFGPPPPLLEPLFPPQPGASPGFAERVRQHKVRLEWVRAEPAGLRGAVRVLNLAYEKAVSVRYTLNRWASCAEVPAAYQPGGPADGLTDRFAFLLPLAAAAAAAEPTLEFAVRYRVAGAEYWDNNEGANYRLRGRQRFPPSPVAMVTCCHNTALPPQDGGRAGTAASLGAMAAAFLRALLLLAAPSSGQPAWDPVFQPSFIHMSGPRVNSFFHGNSSGVNFSIILSSVDEETGSLQLANCSGSARADGWNLNVTPGVNISKVTVSSTQNLQLCLPNATDCCAAPLCVLETLQVLACRDSVVLAHLLIQAEIYANSSFTGNVSENATVIPNQVFQPLGSCPCDLTAGTCDVRCCCDQECTPDLKQLFNGSCFTGVFGGDVNPPFDQLCSSQSMEYTPDWFPFLCVQSSLNNTPFLGYFYHGSTSTPRVPPFKIPLQTSPGKLFTGYRQGDPIMTEENEYFTIPQQSLAGQCVGNAPVAYLQNFDAKCLSDRVSYKDGLPHDVRINTGTGDFIQQNVIYRTVTDTGKFITESESLPTAELLCQNVTFAEHYTFIWKDKNIERINVTVFLGSLCDGEILTQRFTARFLNSEGTNAAEPLGNPGYQVGNPVRAANINASETFGSLNIWQPAGRGLCTSATYTPVLFGLDSLSGCVLEVAINEDCRFLRRNVTEKLNSLIQATHVGKRDNSNYSDLNDWVEIIRLDPFNSDTNVSTQNFNGICPDIPANLNIRIIFADVGAIQGVLQQEILAVQISYSTVIWQFQCGLICENSISFLPITASVQFIEVPAQPPVPMTRFQINYTEFDCNRNDVCWPQLFYPLTRFYTGEPYSRSLAKGLALAFLVLLAALMSNPWFSKIWNSSLL